MGYEMAIRCISEHYLNNLANSSGTDFASNNTITFLKSKISNL